MVDAAVRLIEVFVPAEKREAALRVLEEENLGYRPEGWTPGRLRANVSRNRLGIIAVAVVLGLAVIAGSGFVLGQHVTFQSAVNDEVRTVLDDDRLELVEVRTEFDDGGTVDGETEVTVTVRRPADVVYPELATEIERQLEDRTDRELSVVVEFVEGSTPASEEAGGDRAS